MATPKKTAKKTNGNGKSNGKKSNGKKTVVAKKMTGEGYKGHRPGSLKEKIHQLFDKHGPEKARPLALKTGAALATVNTSFSQFRKVAGRRSSAEPDADLASWPCGPAGPT